MESPNILVSSVSSPFRSVFRTLCLWERPVAYVLDSSSFNPFAQSQASIIQGLWSGWTERVHGFGKCLEWYRLMRVGTSARGKSEDIARWKKEKEKGKRKKRTKVSTFFFLSNKNI